MTRVATKMAALGGGSVDRARAALISRGLEITGGPFSARLSESPPTKSGAWVVVDAAGVEWCRHRAQRPAESCARRPCASRWAAHYRATEKP